jgi:hypothetical protein
MYALNVLNCIIHIKQKLVLKCEVCERESKSWYKGTAQVLGETSCDALITYSMEQSLRH